MFTPDFTLRSGDRNPSVTRTVTVDGVVVDVTGGSVKFRMASVAAPGGTLAVDTAGVVADGPNGVVRYDWTSGDANLPVGFYYGRFEVTLSAKVLTAPNDGWILVQVTGPTMVGWSYSGDPQTSPKDWVRFVTQDTDPTNPKISDAEIAAELAEAGGKWWAAVSVCETIYATFAQKALTSKSVGDISLSYDFRHQATTYQDLAMRLKARALRHTGVAPSMASQSSRVVEGQFDNPGTGYGDWRAL